MTGTSFAGHIYVNAYAPADPGPGNPNQSDPLEDGTASHPFDSIQEAIVAANNADTVIVADGTYSGNGNRDIEFKGKAVTVRSQNGPDSCMIDCQGTEAEPHRGFYIHEGEDANSILEGFTITNGNIPSSQWDVTNGGGAILCHGSPIIRNNKITSNSAYYGGGICSWGSPSITNNLISENTAQLGGGIFTWEDYPATIINNTISQNWAEQQGGGIAISGEDQAAIIGNVIVGNGTSGEGGGIRVISAVTDITNNTIVGNTASSGGGVFGVSAAVTNCIVWGNSENLSGCSATYSCIEGSIPGQGNINSLPQFVNAAGGYYRLRSDSDCIDAGDNPAVPAFMETDIDGNPRITNTTVDIGAYEFIENASIVAHWKLDETSGVMAKDSVGTNDGTLQGGTQWFPYSGRMDGTLLFNGNDGYVDCGNSPDFDITDEITVSAWVTINSIDTTFQTIIAKGDSAWRLSLDRRNRIFHFSVTGPPWNAVNGYIKVEKFEWHHVCGTYDGVNMRLYVDGEEDPNSPVANSSGIETNGYNVYIGANEEQPGRYWDGKIDEVRVYNRTLNASEVHNLFQKAPLYVDADASDANEANYGMSWADAYNHPQDALANAISARVAEIWVAEGTYKPDLGNGITLGDREATFQLVSGVAVRGGYAGFGEPNASTQDITGNKTILSGDLNENDINVNDPVDMAGEPSRGENSRHVVSGSGTNAGAILDGFTITGGYGNGYRIDGGGMYNQTGSPTVTNCIFTGNTAHKGGGTYNELGNPTFSNCTFSGNLAFEDGENYPGGGGMYNFRSNSKLTNCVFISNSASAPDEGGDGGGIFCGDSSATLINCMIIGNFARRYGGGMTNWFGGSSELINCIFSGNSAGTETGGLDNSNGDPELVNCTFSGNFAPRYGGMFSKSAYPIVTNCIFWGNSDDISSTEAAQIHAEIGGPVMNYSCVQGWTGAFSGTGNIGYDPLFVDAAGTDNQPGTEDDNLRLSAGSPCINAGDNKAVRPPALSDPDGNPRITQNVVDMGAYEFQGELIIFVDGVNGNDDNNGSSFQTAFATIQKGIETAKNGYTILVFPDVYHEEIDFRGKAITIRSEGEAAIIEPPPGGYAVSFLTAVASGGKSILRNFVIRNSEIGILVAACVSPIISNVTVVNNESGIAAYPGAKPDISNSIFWNNTLSDLSLWQCQATYSCIERVNEAEGQGNISVDPLFADLNNNDYHLRSERGRYWPTHDIWVLDKETSPCVDRGDPTVRPTGEKMPNGARINMGAYGGTTSASMSEWPIKGDINRDGVVNTVDFAIVAENWLDATVWWAE